jgi:hypothetical protein
LILCRFVSASTFLPTECSSTISSKVGFANNTCAKHSLRVVSVAPE